MELLMSLSLFSLCVCVCVLTMKSDIFTSELIALINKRENLRGHHCATQLMLCVLYAIYEL